MPKKPGNGGHGPEEYDVNTGKYVADGQPNKYYDNPDEKEKYQISSASISTDILKEKFGDIFGETEFDDEINAMFDEKNVEKYTKNIEEMSQEELLTEIGEHKEWLEDYGIVLKCPCLNQDLRLKCSNFREMHRLFEKYPFFKHDKYNLSKPPFEIVQRAMKRRYADCRMVDGDRLAPGSFIISIGSRIRFNSNIFNSYDKVYSMHQRDIKTKFHHDVNDDRISSCTFTHEFGHLLASYFIEESLSENVKSRLNRVLAYSEFSQMVDIIEKDYHKFHETANREIINIFLQDNPGTTIWDFSNEISGYGRKNDVEWFAETFASMECGKPTRTALAMEKWLKQKLGMNQ